MYICASFEQGGESKDYPARIDGSAYIGQATYIASLICAFYSVIPFLILCGSVRLLLLKRNKEKPTARRVSTQPRSKERGSLA